MPTAICTQCGHEQYWKAVRGARLTNIPCEECGGKLRRMNREERKAMKKKVWDKVNKKLAALHDEMARGRHEDHSAHPLSIVSQQLRNSDPSVSAEADELETAKSETPAYPSKAEAEKEKKKNV